MPLLKKNQNMKNCKGSNHILSTYYLRYSLQDLLTGCDSTSCNKSVNLIKYLYKKNFYSFFIVSIFLIILQGFPAATQSAGILFVTTLPAPMMLRAPIVTPLRMML